MNLERRGSPGIRTVSAKAPAGSVNPAAGETGAPGFAVAALSFLIGLFYLIAKLLFWNNFVAGYAPMMIAVFFMGGVQLLFLGFLGEYVMSINTRIMNRPLVVEEERINFDE